MAISIHQPECYKSHARAHTRWPRPHTSDLNQFRLCATMRTISCETKIIHTPKKHFCVIESSGSPNFRIHAKPIAIKNNCFIYFIVSYLSRARHRWRHNQYPRRTHSWQQKANGRGLKSEVWRGGRVIENGYWFVMLMMTKFLDYVAASRYGLRWHHRLSLWDMNRHN